MLRSGTPRHLARARTHRPADDALYGSTVGNRRTTRRSSRPGSEASCELYGILKRPDEKFVTERAYDNPKFVEDIVRDIATRLNRDQRIRSYVVEAENFESIHNHSAYARIARDKDEQPA